MSGNKRTAAGSTRGNAARWLVVVAVAVVAVGAYVLRPAAGGDEADAPAQAAAPADAALPRMVDLGADKCVPCKMMAPILEELKTEYQGRLAIEFIDVWKNPTAGAEYGIKLIPTQIFYAADGTELYRHEGFYGRDDILGKWRELGIDL